GEAMKWIVWSNVSLGEAVGRWTRNTMESIPAELRNAKVGEAALKDVHAHLHTLDGAVHGRSFLAGDYTLADPHVNSLVDWLRHLRIDVTPYKHLETWTHRCAARPAYIDTMKAQAD